MFKEYRSISDADQNVNFGTGTKFIGEKAVVKVAPGGVFRCGKNCTFHYSEIRVESGSTVILGDDCFIRGEIAVHHQGSTVKIGHRLVCNGSLRMRSGEGATITIGDDCLFANPFIYSSDYHGIYDVNTGNRINKSRDLKISDRVWLAHNTMILKGSIIECDSVVGAGAVVAGAFPPNVIIVGNPAKVIRKGILWSRKPHDKITPASDIIVSGQVPSTWLRRFSKVSRKIFKTL